MKLCNILCICNQGAQLNPLLELCPGTNYGGSIKIQFTFTEFWSLEIDIKNSNHIQTTFEINVFWMFN